MSAALIAGLLDHLWQSTLFLGAAGLATLMLRANAARVRFWLWFGASLKFLVPFAAIAALAVMLLPAPQISLPALHQLAPVLRPFPATPAPHPAMAAITLQSADGAHAIMPQAATFDWAGVLVLLWALGALALALNWLRRWRQMRAVLRQARDFPLAGHGFVRASPSLLEPGLFGLWRPVIMVPQGIDRELSAAELDAVLAHEACHRSHRDNLLAAAHMLVEALFWFYPLVWWLGARLNRERERACDEAVLASGREPRIYAESILKVCRLYLQSPLDCVAGISGADLKTRIEWIVCDGVPLKLSGARKFLLGVLAAASFAVPVLASLVVLPAAVQALSPAQPQVDTPARIAERRAEQAAPRKMAAFNPADFDKFTGSYELYSSVVETVSRDAGHYLIQLTGQQPVEVFPESQSKFFTTTLPNPAQISFGSDAAGHVTEAVLHQNGLEEHAPRISAAEAQKLQDVMMQRIRSGTPALGTEASLRRYIASLERGAPNYEEMTPVLASLVHLQFANMQLQVAQWGALKSVTFRNVDVNGMDVYDVVFARARVVWRVGPLTADGKVAIRGFQQVP